jgi:hypothetical protein
MKELADKKLRWVAGLFLVSPLITITGYYLLIGLLGTAMGIGMGGGIKDLSAALFAVVMFLVPIAFLAAMWRGYYVYLKHSHASAPPAILGSLQIAAVSWWAGAGVFLLFFGPGRSTAWIVLMCGAALGWAAITVVAFLRHGRDARWTLLGAPFALYAPAVFLIAAATGMSVS